MLSAEKGVSTKALVAVVALAILASLPVKSEAARPSAPQLLPKKTLFYLRIADVPLLVERFQETALGRIIQDPQLEPMVRQLIASAREAAVVLQEDLGLSIDEMAKIPQGEVVLAAVAMEAGPPAVVVLFDVGDQTAAAQKLLDRSGEAAENAQATKTVETIDGVDLKIYDFSGRRSRRMVQFIKEGTIAVCSNLDAAKLVLANWSSGAKEPLSENQQFSTIMHACRGSKEDAPQLTWFVDPISLVREAMIDNPGAQVGLALLPVLGLDGLSGLGGSFTLATGEFDTVIHAHVLIENPRAGVLELWALESGDVTPPRWVPADVATYATLHWDFIDTYKNLEKLVDSFQGEGATDRELNGRVSRRLGADLATEILPALEGRVTLISRFDRPVTPDGPGSLLGIQLKDPKAFQPVLEKIANQFSNRLEKKSYAGVTYYSLKTATDGADNPTATPQLAVGIVDDCLMLTDRPRLFEKTIVTREDPSGSLANALDYKLIASKIGRQSGGAKVGLLRFERPEESLRYLYDLAMADKTRQDLRERSENNRFFQALNQALEQNPLPPFAVISKYLAPGGGMLIDDETGIHYMGFTLRRE